MHDAVREFVGGWARLVRPPSLVLDVGGLDVNGTVRDLFPPPARYVGLDARPGPGVDVVADGAAWRPPGGIWFDLVLCLETLEHAEGPAALCANLVRLAAPGGLVLVTAAGPGRVPHSCDGHLSLPAGEHYQNISAAELAAWLAPGAAWVLAGETPGGEDVRAAALAGPLPPLKE